MSNKPIPSPINSVATTGETKEVNIMGDVENLYNQPENVQNNFTVIMPGTRENGVPQFRSTFDKHYYNLFVIDGETFNRFQTGTFVIPDEEEKEFFKNTKGQEFTVGYAERSWADAIKYGFLSANIGGSGKYLYNVQSGDTIFCHIAGSGFVGIGECIATAVPMSEFTVDVNGVQTEIAQAPWEDEAAKQSLDTNKEIFIRVAWKKFVTDAEDGYWEKGMTSVPLVAYTLTDKTTYKKVKEHFGYKEEE